MKLIFVVVALVALSLVVVEASRVLDRCNPNLADFRKNNRGQLDAISSRPALDLWYQNITILSYVDGVPVPVVTYGYWQSRVYSVRDCAFVEVQAWYRSENQLAFQQINSKVNELLRLTPSSNGNNRAPFADQTYTVEWKTNLTADSAAVEGSTIKSFTTGPSIVRIDFFDPQTNIAFFTEELRTVRQYLRRFYTQTMTVDPTGSTLPLLIAFDSFVVPRSYQPEFVRDAFDAWGSRQVPVEQDPQDPSRYIYLYTGATAQKTSSSSSSGFTLPSGMSVDDFLTAQGQHEEIVYDVNDAVAEE